MVLFSLGSPPKLVLIWWFHILLWISQTYITNSSAPNYHVLE